MEVFIWIDKINDMKFNLHFTLFFIVIFGNWTLSEFGFETEKKEEEK
jgi:hypothetical protein